jgi:superfamily II DNA or RNA helicase
MNAIYLAEREKVNCDSSRSKKQWDCVIKWLENLYKGTIVACTGFGKTRIATHIIKLLKKKGNRSAVVVVPSNQLKSQWEQGLRDLKIEENVQVWVINSLIKQDAIECDLLILDEIHRVPAPTFSKTFKVVSYRFILGLTATLERSDGKHKIIEEKAPVLERIPLREARKNGWVSNYRHYNLYVRMSEETSTGYMKKTKLFGQAMDKFERDFKYMKDCTNLKPTKRSGRWQPPPVVELAKTMGWRGNHIGTAFDNIRYNKTAPRGQKRSIWGNDDHTYSPKRLNTWAIIGMQAIRDLKTIIYNSPEKT